jgi:hypothetical protein
MAQKASAFLSQPPEEWSQGTYRKAATLATTFMAGWGDEGGGEEAAPPAAPATNKGPFDDLEQDLAEHLMDRIRKKIKKDMDSSDVGQMLTPETPASTTEGLVKEGQHRLTLADLVQTPQRDLYGTTLSFVCRTASNEADLMNRVALLNGEYGIDIPVPLYRVALRLGTLKDYTSMPQFLRACQAALGTTPTIAEVKTLIRLGKLLSRRDQDRRGNSTSLVVAK